MERDVCDAGENGAAADVKHWTTVRRRPPRRLVAPWWLDKEGRWRRGREDGKRRGRVFFTRGFFYSARGWEVERDILEIRMARWF